MWPRSCGPRGQPTTAKRRENSAPIWRNCVRRPVRSAASKRSSPARTSIRRSSRRMRRQTRMRDILREELAFCDMFAGAKELTAEAEKIYGELKDEWPDRASIWLRLGQLRRDAGDFEKTREFMERGLAVADARPDPDPDVQRQ